jgi:hypothetical protein
MPSSAGSGTSTDAPFYVSAGETFVAQEGTRGPWSKDHQHAGPPSALAIRAAERLLPEMRVARVTCEMLKPVPLARVMVKAEIEKAGRKSALVRAHVIADERVCIDARIALVRREPIPEVVRTHDVDVVALAESAPFVFPFFSWPVGYHTAVELKLARGVFGTGKTAFWMRQRGALVAGEEPSGAQRVAVVADAGSGITLAIDTRTHTCLNSDLTIHMFDDPRGEWILLDGRTWIGPEGRGLAETRVSDERGVVGRGLQTLVVERRS